MNNGQYTETNNGRLLLRVSHNCNAKASFTEKLLKMQCFQCDNLHKIMKFHVIGSVSDTKKAIKKEDMY
jgi:hypothetical protein